MKIQLDERLQAYMKEKKQHNILISSTLCNTWGGPSYAISARFVDPKETQMLKEQNYLSIPHKDGEILLQQEPLSADETVRLGLSRFFKQITVEGIYAI